MNAPAQYEHRGRSIVELDFSGLKDFNEIKSRIVEYHAFIASHPKRSLLVVTNLTGCVVNKYTVEYFKQFTADNKPFIIASAVYGLTGFAKIFVNAVNAFSKRDIRHFDSPERARDW